MSAQHKYQMPALPKSFGQIDIYHSDGSVTCCDGFTANQTHDYARAYAADRDARIAELEKHLLIERENVKKWMAMANAQVELAELARSTQELSAAVAARQSVEAQPVALTETDHWALEYAVCALRAIAERREQITDTIYPLNDIRTASARARHALGRLEPVVRRLCDAPPVAAAQQPAAVKAEVAARNLLLALQDVAILSPAGSLAQHKANAAIEAHRALLAQQGVQVGAVDRDAVLEEAAATAEKASQRQRWITAGVNASALAQCPIAAAIRALKGRGENRG